MASNYSATIESRARAVGELSHMTYLMAGSGEPLVLLHGFPQHSYMWRGIMPQLAEKYTVIAPDQRGVGGTARPDTGYDKRTLAQDVYALVHDQLGFERVKLVGYDFGAGTAYAYAAAHPEAVEKLVLAEFVFPGFGYEEFIAPKRGWEQAWQLVAFTVPDIAERFLVGRERELLAWYFQINCANPEAVGLEEFEVYVRALQRPGALRAGLQYYASVWDDSDHNKENVRRGKLKMPVLQIGGEKSVGANGLPSVQSLADNVRSHVIKDAGHWLVEEQPQAFTQALLDFFQSDKAT